MSSPLRDYQADAAATGYHVVSEYGGFYIQHDPGMGKTLALIALARLLKVHRVCVVCPPIALGVWQRQMRQWWPQFAVEDGRNEMRCISYDSLSDPVPSEVGTVRRQTGRNRLRELCEWSPELLVLDEAHYAKSPSSSRTRAVMQLANYSIYRVALSGTPTHNDLDLWAQYRIIGADHPLWKMSFTDYKTTVYQCHPTGGYPLKNKDGSLRYKPGARELIREATATWTHIATADQMELPEPVETVVPFELDPRESKAYGTMEKVLRADLPDGTEAEAEIVLTKMLRLTQIAAGHVTNTDGDTSWLGDSRFQACLGLLADRPEQKVVIACRFKEDIRRLMTALNAWGRPATKIDGETPAKYRTQYEDWFQSDKSPRDAVMLLQYQAGGTAITLTASHTLILYTLDLSVIRYRQMLGRIWRLGQKGLCEVLVPVAEDTQDEDAYAGLKSGDDNRLANLLLGRLHHGT